MKIDKKNLTPEQEHIIFSALKAYHYDLVVKYKKNNSMPTTTEELKALEDQVKQLEECKSLCEEFNPIVDTPGEVHGNTENNESGAQVS